MAYLTKCQQVLKFCIQPTFSLVYTKVLANCQILNETLPGIKQTSQGDATTSKQAFPHRAFPNN